MRRRKGLSRFDRSAMFVVWNLFRHAKKDQFKTQDPEKARPSDCTVSTGCHSSLDECHLSRVKRCVIGAAEKDGKPIPRRIFGKVSIRNCGVLLEPVVS